MGLKCLFVFQCGELLDRFSAGGQWRWWRVLLRQTGRAQLRQENQRLVVPVVSSTRLCNATPVSRQPPSSLCSFLSPLFLVNTRKHQHYPGQAVVANCVCLCSSDCESREVLTLLCQGKIFAEIYYHCLTHCGQSLTFFDTLGSSFSSDLCVFLCFFDTCTSCLVFLIPSFLLIWAYLVCFASVVSLNDPTLLGFDFPSALSPQTAVSVVLRQTV